MRQNETDKKLTPKQARAIEAIMSEPTIRGAARRAGVGHATLYRWLDEAAFAEALREARGRAFERTLTGLAALAETSIEVLREILGDEAAVAAQAAVLRSRVAKTALDAMLRAHSLIEFEERLKVIEAQLKTLETKR